MFASIALCLEPVRSVCTFGLMGDFDMFVHAPSALQQFLSGQKVLTNGVVVRNPGGRLPKEVFAANGCQ